MCDDRTASCTIDFECSIPPLSTTLSVTYTWGDAKKKRTESMQSIIRRVTPRDPDARSAGPRPRSARAAPSDPACIQIIKRTRATPDRQHQARPTTIHDHGTLHCPHHHTPRARAHDPRKKTHEAMRKATINHANTRKDPAVNSEARVSTKNHVETHIDQRHDSRCDRIQKT